MDKLKRLELMLADFQNWQTVQNYFIGALSTEVPDKVWDKCLDHAKKCSLEQGAVLTWLREAFHIETNDSDPVCYWCQGPRHPEGEVCKQAPYYVES